VRRICVVCELASLLPDTVISKIPVGAVLETEKLTDWLASAWMVKLEAGNAATSVGNPEKLTFTEPLNPCRGVIETVTGELMFPITAEAEIGQTARLKSGFGGGIR
jgi:hypothetical protein